MTQTAQIIQAGQLDPKFKHEVSKIRGAEKIMLCFQCGTCTSDCPVSRFSDFYRPRKIARMVQFGLKARILSDKDLWLCTTCYTCIDRCPQDVDVANVVRVLRNQSVKYTNSMPLVFKVLAGNLMKTGFVYTIPDSRHKRRVQMGLPPLPETKPGEIAKLFEKTGFAKLLESVETFEKVE
jgi:heterodisulfide reductase subunit C